MTGQFALEFSGIGGGGVVCHDGTLDLLLLLGLGSEISGLPAPLRFSADATSGADGLASDVSWSKGNLAGIHHSISEGHFIGR